MRVDAFTITQITLARLYCPLFTVSALALARKREINFQSTSHVMTVISLPLTAAEALHEKTTCEIDKRALERAFRMDLKVSIKRSLPRARSFSAIDHVFHYGPQVPRTYDSRYIDERLVAVSVPLLLYVSLRLRNRWRRKSGTRLLRAYVFAYDARNSRRRATYKLFYELIMA